MRSVLHRRRLGAASICFAALSCPVIHRYVCVCVCVYIYTHIYIHTYIRVIEYVD